MLDLLGNPSSGDAEKAQESMHEVQRLFGAPRRWCVLVGRPWVGGTITLLRYWTTDIKLFLIILGSEKRHRCIISIHINDVTFFSHEFKGNPLGKQMMLVFPFLHPPVHSHH